MNQQPQYIQLAPDQGQIQAFVAFLNSRLNPSDASMASQSLMLWERQARDRKAEAEVKPTAPVSDEDPLAAEMNVAAA